MSGTPTHQVVECKIFKQIQITSIEVKLYNIISYCKHFVTALLYATVLWSKNTIIIMVYNTEIYENKQPKSNSTL